MLKRMFMGTLALGLVVGGMSYLATAGAPKTIGKKAKPKAVQSAEVGSTAPDFTLVSTTGKAVKLSTYRGKLVVLEWLNHGCPFVKKHYDSFNMQKLQNKYREQGVVWLSIVSSAPGRQGFYKDGQANELTKSKKANPTAVLKDPSGKVGKIYQAMTTPHMYVIDKEGKLRYAGAIDSVRSADPADVKKAENYVSKALDQLKAGKKVTTPKTRPYGCSVKYAG